MMEIKPFPKKTPMYDDELREWIRRHRCHICGSRGTEHDDGVYRVTPSHMLSRGSGRGDYYNLIPMCLSCHRRFEEASSHERSTFKAVAYRYTTTYLEMKFGPDKE